MAAASTLETELGVDVTLIAGKGGVFEVAVDGEIVAKRTRESFPDENTIVVAVKKLIR